VQQTVSGTAQLAVAQNGTAVFLSGGAAQNTVVQVGRDGSERPLLTTPQGYKDPRYSPDGTRLAFEITTGSLGDLWIYNLASATTTRLTFGSENLYPVWSPDGRRIAFTSRQTGIAGLWWASTDGSGQPEQLIPGNQLRFPSSFTPDGHTLLYRESAPQTGMDLYALPLDGDRTPVPVLVTPFNENSPELSPDGHWLAYTSDQSGRYEIYLRAYPGGGAQWQVSANGGTEPVWSPDGRVVYYRQGSRVMSASLRFDESAHILKRDSLFTGPYLENVRWPEFDIRPDGGAFVFVRVGQSTVRPVVVINWVAALERRGE
jgi:Tol biopolymer transport system component